MNPETGGEDRYVWGPLPEMVDLAPRRYPQRYPRHILLFLLTWASTTLAGLVFVTPDTVGSYGDMVAYLPQAFLFSTLLMFFLSAHEFGHYFAARAHGVATTLPFYIPLPFLSPFGTMGAVIRIRSSIPSRRALFDIGVAGPLSGFVVALAYLVIGMLSRPGIETIYAIHPAYRTLSGIPDAGMRFGNFALFAGLRALLVPRGAFFPPMNELYHYPLLAVGWFGMLVTALNMLPLGQLDGGHIVYSMFGRRQEVIARWAYRVLLVIGLGAIVSMLWADVQAGADGLLPASIQNVLAPVLGAIARAVPWWLDGFPGWILWALLVRFIIKLKHPPVGDDTPLDRRRMAIGWLSLVILALTFSYSVMIER
ncbi:MAG: site-2 protease family protein [Bacteroidetes bacterium]|nr:site-2 protease family protein [Bacteroidota bacterium]